MTQWVVEFVIDMYFIVDVVLNFKTTFINGEGLMVVDAKAIYLQCVPAVQLRATSHLSSLPAQANNSPANVALLV